jgi:16S rRNA processing protein RimM
VLLKKLLNCKLFLPKTNKIQQKKTELTSHEIIGFTVIDKTEGIIGPIDDIIKYPNNPLYKIIYNEKEILVPANENIICTIDFDKKEVVVNIPTGLLEL